MTGKRLEDVVVAVGYMISPLRLARQECEQLLFFSERGLRMSIGHLPSQGKSAPITLAGSITLALAEQIFLFLLQRAFREDAVFAIGGDVMTMDMRKAASCYGRPEQQRINVAFADLARFYGCLCYGHTGLSDAKLPSFEAGVQKSVGALITALAVGRGTIEAGLLSTDEICSPIQMILDHVSFKHGIIQPVGDTTGPGGLARALRHIPVHVQIARDMEDLCPRATLYNFTNPLTVMTQAITRFKFFK
jgi:trimethylamine:corrinoid methyltransferase-like protein